MRLDRFTDGAVLVIVLAVIGVGVFTLTTLGHGPGSSEELHVSQASDGEIDGSVLAYEDMTDDQQRLFTAAVPEGRETIPNDVDESVWIDDRWIRYQNETYSVAVAVP